MAIVLCSNYMWHAGPRWLLDRNIEWQELHKAGVEGVSPQVFAAHELFQQQHSQQLSHLTCLLLYASCVCSGNFNEQVSWDHAEKLEVQHLERIITDHARQTMFGPHSAHAVV